MAKKSPGRSKDLIKIKKIKYNYHEMTSYIIHYCTFLSGYNHLTFKYITKQTNKQINNKINYKKSSTYF